MGMVKTFGIGMLGLGHVGRQGGMSPVVDLDPQYRYFTDENGLQWRQGIRDGYIVLDVALTATGFSGTEDLDWVNVEKTAYLTIPIPTGLTVVWDGDYMKLDWVSDYAVEIERSLTDETNYTYLATVNAGTLTYTDQTVDVNEEYYYRIKAVVGSIYGPYCVGVISSILDYWTNSGLFLFFGEVSKISGGRLNNQVTGASDYLTVGGSAGSETYQCPNAAPYIAADSDYLWFKSLASSPRLVLTSELVGYDYPRTIVKYLDVAPYTVEWIAILKPASSVTNAMRDAFHLSIFWDNTSSDHGYTKGNRAAEQSVWPIFEPETIALVARYGTPPSASLKTLIDKTYADLKYNAIYNSLVQFTKANIHNETDAKLNWIGNTFPIVPIGSPVFTAKQGWACVIGKYLKSGFTPSVQIASGNIGVDDAGFLVDKYLSAGDNATFKLNGAFKFGDFTKRFSIATYSTNNKKCNGYLNSNTSGGVTSNNDVSAADGVFYIERNSNSGKGYYNKVQSSDITQASLETTVDQEIYFGASHDENNAASFFARETLRSIVLCKYLGSTKQALLYDIIKYFNDNVGVTF